MQVVHPRALADAGGPPAAVDVDGEAAPVDEEGVFEVPDDATAWLDRFATAHGHDPDDLVYEEDGPPDAATDADDGDSDDSVETCDVEMSNGEVCGRELPCRYHSDEQED